MNLRALFVWIFSLFLISFPTINVSAQPPDQPVPAVAPSGAQSDVISNQEIDQDNIEKLRKMSPEKTAELDKKIDEALKLYNQSKFGQALPIFKEISNEVETMSILWWLGTSAMSVGDLNLAADKFKKMLVIDPTQQRVRLELAAVYFELARYEEARKELEIVKASKPPEPVLKNIDQLLAAIEERSRRLFTNVRLSQGIMWDDNVNGGPDNRELAVIGGTLTLDTESTRVRDWASVTSLSGNALYDFRKWGLMWNTTADLYYKNYFDHSRFNFSTMDLTTGPWWTARQDIVKVPIGYMEKEYGSDRLSHVFHVDPNYEHFFNPFFSLRGQFSYSKEHYYADSNQDLNNVTKSYELAPSVYLFNRQHIISLTAGYTFYDADARRYTYTAPYYGISYFVRFPTKTEFLAKYQWTQKDYKEAPLLYSDERVDRQNSITAILSQEFLKYLYTSFVFTYVKNRSNAELYSYDQTTYTLNVGCKF
jgi:tetratricopeptide (TPR) repeat protein